jgi:uncharacterized protein YbjT (DUF2867 family)
MNKKILVLGATGFTGSAISRRLMADGFSVRTIARDPLKAQQMFNGSVEVLNGNAQNAAILSDALEGCEGVHISLPWQIEAQVAAQVLQGMQTLTMQGAKITYISGNTVISESRWHPMVAQKEKTEKLIIYSGQPYTIFKPGWFMDSLPLFVNNGRATVFGNQNLPIRFIALDDFAGLVSAAHQSSSEQCDILVVDGPEALTIPQALQQYCDALRPGLTVASMPIWFGRMLGVLSRDQQLKDFVSLLAYFEKVTEVATADGENGKCATPTTLAQWIRTVKKEK